MAEELVKSGGSAFGLEKISKTMVWGGAAALLGGMALLWWGKRKGGDLGRVQGVTNRGGMTLTHYRSNMPIKERVGILQNLTWESVNNPEMRKLALSVTNKCKDRDDLCEAREVYNAIKRRIRYTGDVAPIKHGKDGPVEGVDLFQAAHRTWEFGGGDCLPLWSTVLRDDFSLVPIAALNPGDRIMGDGEWTTIQERWLTGEKEILVLGLNTGKTLRCSTDHKLFVWRQGEVVETKAGDVRLGEYLATPERIPFVLGDCVDQAVAKLMFSRSGKPSRVVSLDMEPPEICADLTTDQGKFWLPESDVLVHNCDDHSILGATLLAHNGIPAKFRVTAPTKSGKEDWGHIYVMAGLPKNDPKKWIALDTTLPGNRFNYEAPYGKKIDFVA